MDNDILDSIAKGAKVLLYPSSCQYHPEFDDVPFDVVILNSYEIQRPRKIGKVLCLNYDNNELVGRLVAKKIEIAALMIIRDGCCEGGNYECIATDGFFGRLMPIMGKEFEYHCDHGDCELDVPARFEEVKSPDYLSIFINHSDPLNRVRSFQISQTPVVEKDFLLGRIRVKVVRDSIWRHYSSSDWLILRNFGIERDHRAIKSYLKGLAYTGKFCLIGSGRTTTIKPYLQQAATEQLSKIFLMPIGDGRYQRIVDEIRKWHGDYPQEIHFYHINSGDYEYLKSLSV